MRNMRKRALLHSPVGDKKTKSKREFTEFLDEEIARLGRQRQQLIDLRRLYEPKEEALPEAPAAMAVSTEDMIVRVLENAGTALTREQLRDALQRDYGRVPEDFEVVLELALRSEAARLGVQGEGYIGLAARSAARLKGRCAER